MNPVYSTYEAKARFSEVLRLVREGAAVTITYRGDPVAEIRPLAPDATSVEEHFARLEERGIVVPAADPNSPLEPGPPNPGGLARFLAERNE
ncbi:MAG: type II toxin-antitoxin system prevent-host-death family antitoxin [Gemmatimonadota bacterium]|nr:type II toxin-antitoxin system prevent-host-death family antitoxin [Gemmatimonadota bacterium]